jgi:L-Ala-D/L-Glu epimerase
MLIKNIRLFHAKIKLIKPYKLSFKTITKLDSIVIEIELENGAKGVGEAVPLKGYSHETRESIINDIKYVINKIDSMDVYLLKGFIEEKLENSPFVVSAFLVAVEMAINKFPIPSRISIPLVCSISAGSNYTRLVKKAHNYYENGFRTIKIKVGRDLKNDCLLAKKLLDELPEDYRIRFDANQGYNYQQATEFIASMCNSNLGMVELIEQPFGIFQWSEHKKLIRDFPEIPIMIDESIITRDDITKAADIRATHVKLKLFKHKGITDLLDLAKYARELGLKVVLGNGVSSSIGNLQEAVAYKIFQNFEQASEGNGFTRLVDETMINPPKLFAGCLEWSSSDVIGINQFNDQVYSLIFQIKGVN